MHAPAPTIVIQCLAETHLESLTALYNDPVVCRQVLQMPYQSIEVWRKRLAASHERQIKLVALQGSEVIGHIGLEQYSRIRQTHVGGIGMVVTPSWHRKGVGSKLLTAALEVADNWMNLRRVELTVYADNQPAIGLYEKYGFESEGLLRQYAVRDGVMVDALTMARLR
ncbi:GNAT family N-acetyltransferase [Pseudomonas floridensis]|uniref:GNAT family N-acetyltransferase n=1 Tax=Pseudomonas floridensis TaxID=1958950 RepID=A0A1X0ND47_9PSED|nr:GNAT family N-acetyltransferase [Pseudomonas floridensis]ORC62230.1 GNAT family N-acetyltransferase [Pseudomonas floridensis]